MTNDRLANYYFEAVQRVSPELRAAFDKALAQLKEDSGLDPALVGWSTAFGLAWLSVSCFWLATIPLCLLCCGHPQASRHPHRMVCLSAAALILHRNRDFRVVHALHVDARALLHRSGHHRPCISAVNVHECSPTCRLAAVVTTCQQKAAIWPTLHLRTFCRPWQRLWRNRLSLGRQRLGG